MIRKIILYTMITITAVHCFSTIRNVRQRSNWMILESKPSKSSRKPQSTGSNHNPSVEDKLDTVRRKELLMELINALTIDADVSDLLNDLGSMEEEAVDDCNLEQAKQSKLLNSVIRIYCTHSPPNFNMPWQRQKQDFSSSTGFVLPDRRILTNAHSVEYGSLVQVKKRQSESKYVASVVAVSHECDLAILRVDSDEFWEDLDPLHFGELPDLFQDVSVVGYPIGGDSVSITSGVVSRIEMQEYAQASAQLLAIQIDAAINPGNSGGPVVNDKNEVVGVAFQSLSAEDTENIGYVIPVPVIAHFLEDVRRHHRFSGVCGLGVRMQGIENAALRRHCGLAPTDTGVLVLSVAPLSPAGKQLCKGDVLLAVDGIKVANDATIPFREGSLYRERVHLSYYFTLKFPGDVVQLEILRNGTKMVLSTPLCVPTPLVPNMLIKNNFIDAAANVGTGSQGSIVGGVPSYLVAGGLVFIAVTQEYLRDEFSLEHMADLVVWAEELRLLGLSDNSQSENDQEVVLLSQIIAHSCNVGYDRINNVRLARYNNTPVLNLRHLKTLMDSGHNCCEETMVFEFVSGQKIVLDKAEALAAQSQICREHFIPSPCSGDLLSNEVNYTDN